jgi:polyisoprenoid-binding protein YceI
VIKRLVALGMVLMLIIFGVVAYGFLKPPKEASGPIEAIPVAVDRNPVAVDQNPVAVDRNPVVVEQPTSADPTQAPATAEPEPTIEAAAAAVTPTSEPEPTTTREAAPVPQAAESETAPDVNSSPVIFEIVQTSSETRFIINEVLNGAPKTVVGVTDQVAGEIAIFVDDPSRSQIGTILVNARTLVTDNEFRNRAIKNRILQTDDFEFVTFTPTEIAGLPGDVTIGAAFSFQIIGDLTVRDVTNPVTFDVTVTPVSETQLEGLASTAILYPDFNLTIPEAPAVASVDDEVILEIEFVAVAK